MGMFDYINFKQVCPSCGNIASNAQSKSGPCELLTLEPDEVDYFTVYCACGKDWSYEKRLPKREPREVQLTEQQLLSRGYKKHK